jgi:hypothetical protein
MIHMMKTRWLYRITFLYLLIPFIIFCMGWLRLAVMIPVAALLLLVAFQLMRHAPEVEIESSPKFLIALLFFTGAWVFLSGVGGYAFQNWDHHWRNAVLRDLIAYDWPVFYTQPEKGPINMLVYYVGYWLPAALAGKLFGWKFASFILYLWTWLGVLLVVVHLHRKLKTSLLNAALLLIFFSGIDALGSLFFPAEYPTLWPPAQHLEIWSANLQYSSFSTQLFWVFNQAVPAWLCAALILESNSLLFDQSKRITPSVDQKVLIWSLCFFFAPLASIGLLPYQCIEWVKGKDFKLLFKNPSIVPLLASGVIVTISYLFFSSNTAAQERGLQAISIGDFLPFFLLEGGILWLMLAPSKWRDPRWIVTGLLLLILPFVQIGSGRDFVMRASIAPLFYLMIMTAEVLFQPGTPRFYRVAFAALLLIGALTPLYEINRSVQRTFEYYFVLDESDFAQPPLEPVTHLAQAGAPESEHPGALTAEGIPTLKFMTDELSRNFIANVRQSLYYRFLSAR